MHSAIRGGTLSPPAGTDHRQDYYENVTFVGDWSGHDLRDADMESCVVQWTGAPSMVWLQSHRTVWTGAKIPNDLGVHHQLEPTIEVVAQSLLRIPPMGARSVMMANEILSYTRYAMTTNREHYASFEDTFQHLVDQFSLTQAQVLAAVLPIFDGYPRIQRRLRHVGANPRTPTKQTDMDGASFRIIATQLRNKEARSVDVRDLLGIRSRWMIGEAIRQRIARELGRVCAVWIQTLEPFVGIAVEESTLSTTDFGWWNNFAEDQRGS